MEYNKTNKNLKENTRIFSRLNYYYKNRYFNDIERDDAIEITKYLINNKFIYKIHSFRFTIYRIIKNKNNIKINIILKI